MTPENYMYRVYALRDELNGLVYPITGVEKVFDAMTLIQPKFSPAELGFIRSVSWLYGFYYEAGKIGVGFLIKYLEVYRLEDKGRYSEHYKVVGELRTLMGHNLNVDAVHDKRLLTKCQQWFKQGCGTYFPSEENHWQPLLTHLLGETVAFLEVLIACVRKIEADESNELIYGQWALRLRRYYPPHLFDEMIPEVLQDIGRGEMDPMRLRKKHYADWARAFETYADEPDFKTEARKLIESAVLSETKKTLPITGKDVIEYFDIVPGQEVGNILEQAKQLYSVDACGKEDLLRKLSELRTKDMPIAPGIVDAPKY